MIRFLALVVLTGCSLINNAAGNYKPSREAPIECSHKIPHRVDLILAVPFALESIVLAGILSADTHTDRRSSYVAGMATSALVSGLFVGSAVYGSSRNAECEAELEVRRVAEAEATARADHAREEQLVAAKAARDRKHHVIELAKQAAEAARTGDCATVTTIDPQVCTLDADYRNNVFVRDVAVARCLGEPQPCPPKSE